jgi:hypothetical protein
MAKVVKKVVKKTTKKTNTKNNETKAVSASKLNKRSRDRMKGYSIMN